MQDLAHVPDGTFIRTPLLRCSPPRKPNGARAGAASEGDVRGRMARETNQDEAPPSDIAARFVSIGSSCKVELHLPKDRRDARRGNRFCRYSLHDANLPIECSFSYGALQPRGILFSRCSWCHFCQSSRTLCVRVTTLGTKAITGALSAGSSSSASSNPADAASRSTSSPGASATTASSSAVRTSRRAWLRSSGVSRPAGSFVRCWLLTLHCPGVSCLFDTGAQPDSPHAVGLRIAAERVVDIRGYEDDSCRSTFVTLHRSARALDVTAAFTAFPPHIRSPFCLSGLCLHEDVETHSRTQSVLTVIWRGRAFSTFGSSSLSTPSVSLASIFAWSIVSDSVNCRKNVPD